MIPGLLAGLLGSTASARRVNLDGNEKEMRVNIEDSIHSEGQARAVAEILNIHQDEAIGVIYWLWRDSQEAGFDEGTWDDLWKIVSRRFVRFDHRAVRSAFFSSGVVTSTAENSISVVGNSKHTARLREFKRRAQAGGQASAQARSQPHRLTTPVNLESTLLTPYSLHTENMELKGESEVSNVTKIDFDDDPLSKSSAPASPRSPYDSGGFIRPTKMMEPFVCQEHGKAMQLANRPAPESYDAQNHRSAGRIYAKSPKSWQQVVAWFCSEDKYGFCGWSIDWLAKNYDEVAAKALGGPTDILSQVMKLIEQEKK